MDAKLSDQHRDFQAEVRVFLAEKITPEIKARERRQTAMAAEPELGMWWHRTLFEKGWIAPAWPVEYGGTGWDVVRRHIFEEECALAGAPHCFIVGLQMCGPVIMRFGTPEQKAYFLPRILSGEHYWSQGFSEPGSGSDLASLRTRAVRDGDDYVVNGSKIWTTHAHNANWIFMLVRTSTEGRPQSGITFLLSPLDAQGITIRPIVFMSGEHEVNQVFFDELRVPVVNRVGEENAGWSVAKYLLEFERAGSFAAGGRALIEQAREIASVRDEADGGCLWDDPAFRRRFAEIDIQLIAQSWTEKRVVASGAAGQNVGNKTASILKVGGSELRQRATELFMQALGELAQADQRRALAPGSKAPAIGPEFAVGATARFLNDRSCTIAGGSSEVLRNIIARGMISG